MRKYWYSRLGSFRGSSLSSSESNGLVIFWPSVGHSVPFLQQSSFPLVFVDPVFVSLLVLVVTLSGRSRDFVDPRLLNLHLRPAKMNVEVFSHAI